MRGDNNAAKLSYIEVRQVLKESTHLRRMRLSSSNVQTSLEPQTLPVWTIDLAPEEKLEYCEIDDFCGGRDLTATPGNA